MPVGIIRILPSHCEAHYKVELPNLSYTTNHISNNMKILKYRTSFGVVYVSSVSYLIKPEKHNHGE